MTHGPERSLYEPTLEALARWGWLRDGAFAAMEVPVFGRLVDLAIESRSGLLLAFEFKMADFGRVLRQARQNALAFDRSFVVVARAPSAASVARARNAGVGVIVVTGGIARKVSPAARRTIPLPVRNRVRSAIGPRRIDRGSDVPAV